MRRALAVVVLGLGLSITLADIALARIKLITLPVRERVEIQLDNPTTRTSRSGWQATSTTARSW
jgi:hypothetical protein